VWGAVVWGADVVVGVVFSCFVCGARVRFPMAAVWALDVQRLCLLIATYSVYMSLGDGIHATPAAGLGGCGLCVCGRGWSKVW
jgi:hypothetical protein